MVAAYVRLPGATFAPAGLPVPDNDTVCGLLPAESVKVSVADRGPVDDGLNVTLTLQLPEPARLVPQVFAEIVKSEAFAPVMVMLLMLTAAVPPLLRVTGWARVVVPTAVAAYVRPAGVTVAGAATPAPERPTD